MSGFIYLASPYSHPSDEVRQARYDAAVCAVAALLKRHYVVYSPIVHSHPIEQWMGARQPHEFWMRQDMAMLRHAAELYVLQLDGWDTSHGVQQEIETAHRLGLQVGFVPYETLVGEDVPEVAHA